MFNKTSFNPFRNSASIGSDTRLGGKQPISGSAATQPRSLPTLSASTFMVHPTDRNGDCFYKALTMGLRDSGASVTDGEAKNLRNHLANYVETYSGALSVIDGFEGANGVANLLLAVSTPKMWNSKVGDLAPILAAQAAGREVHIIQSIVGDNSNYSELAVIPAYNPDMPGVDMRERLPPIYLLNTDNHYEFLEVIAAVAPIELSPLPQGPPSDSGSDSGSGSVRNSSSDSISPYLTLSENYSTFVNGDLLGYKLPLKEASPEQLHNALIKLNRVFSQYSEKIQTVQTEEVKHRNASDTKLLKRSRQRAQKLEDGVGNNISKRHGLTKREGPLGMLKAMNILVGRMQLELDRLVNDSANDYSGAMDNCKAEIGKLTKALQQPSFDFDNDKLITNMAKLGVSPPSAAGPAPEDPLVTLTEDYNDFVNDVLLEGVATLESADQGELNGALDNLGKIFRSYSYTANRFDDEIIKTKLPRGGVARSAKTQYRDEAEVKTLRLKMHGLENKIDNNISNTHGISYRDGRQGMLKALNLLYARIDQELENRFPQVEGSELKAGGEATFDKLALAKELQKPTFKHDVDKLAEDRDLYLPKDPHIAEKTAAMEAYIDDTANTIALLSTQGNTAGALPKVWQSKEVDSIVSKVQVKLDGLKKKLRSNSSDATVVKMGVNANKTFEQCYRDIAHVAKKQINKRIHISKGDTGKAQALGVLRDTAHLAAQHHLSSRQVGLVTGVNVVFKSNLPRHLNERIATAPTPGVNVSESTTAAIGVSASVFSVASVAAVISTKSNSTNFIVRSNEANLYGENTTETSVSMGVSASVGTTDAVAGHVLEGLKVPKGAAVAGNVVVAQKTGFAGLAVTPAAMLGALHAPTLSQGDAIGGSVGKFSRLTGIEDVFGDRRLAGLSAPSLSLGYNNDKEVAAGLRRLLGGDVETVYDHEGKAPLGQLFTLTSLVKHKLKPQAAAIDGHEKSVMSESFPDPHWVSRKFTTKSVEADVLAEASLGFKSKGGGLETQGGFFDTQTSRAFFKTLGFQVGAVASKKVIKVERTVRSPKMPHDIFNPALTRSPRRCAIYAQDYYDSPSPAELKFSRPIAEMMGFVDERGFGDVLQYFEAMAGSFDMGGPQVNDIDAPKRAGLTRLYKDFQKDINLIDNFYLQPQTSIRQHKKSMVQEAIDRINTLYGALLPSIDDTNIGDVKVQTTNPITKNKRYTASYRQFQDTAVAILGSFSAAGGAIKLMSSHHAPKHSDQQKMLDAAAKSLLDPMELLAMPWNKHEIASRSTYVRQVVAKPYSSSVVTTKTGTAEQNHTLRGGDYDVTQLIAGDATSFIEESSTGLGKKVTRRQKITTYPDNVTFPGHSGTANWTTDTYRKLKLPFRDLMSQTTYEGRIREMLLQVFTFKKEIDYIQAHHKAQTYPAKADDDSTEARKFTAYRSETERKERGVSVRVGGRIPTCTPVTLPLRFRQTEDKNDYELKNFTYGNDVGAMAVIMTKLFADNKIVIADVQKQIIASEKSKTRGADGSPITFIDSLDPRVAEAFLGDQQYDNMSAILSKFRNAAFVEDLNHEGIMVLKTPNLDPSLGTAIYDTISEKVRGKLHDSKGRPMRLSSAATPQEYIDRSSFLGYVVARYDDNFLQDGYKYWKSTYGVKKGEIEVNFPDALEIDKLLSKPTGQTKGELEQTRQQWLKAASKQERKDFYQNNPDGKVMLLDYLKVVSLAGVFNDVLFQNNTYQMIHDEEQVKRVNKYFISLDGLASEAPLGNVKGKVQQKKLGILCQ